jgi:hypothetical protein
VRKAIPFEAVRRLLKDLGFTERQGKDSRHVFEHESGTLFLFRPYHASEQVSPADLLSLQVHLDMGGLFERNAFEEWQHETAV